jgi:hypothetical protein
MAETGTLEKMLAPFQAKGPAIQGVRKEGDPEHYFDIMEREFRPYELHGKSDVGSADVLGSEQEFVNVARQAREQRLVGMANGQVARVGGSLQDGTGFLYDANGRLLSRGQVQEAPLKATRRSPKNW